MLKPRRPKSIVAAFVEKLHPRDLHGRFINVTLTRGTKWLQIRDNNSGETTWVPHGKEGVLKDYLTGKLPADRVKVGRKWTQLTDPDGGKPIWVPKGEVGTLMALNRDGHFDPDAAEKAESVSPPSRPATMDEKIDFLRKNGTNESVLNEIEDFHDASQLDDLYKASGGPENVPDSGSPVDTPESRLKQAQASSGSSAEAMKSLSDSDLQAISQGSHALNADLAQSELNSRQVDKFPVGGRVSYDDHGQEDMGIITGHDGANVLIDSEEYGPISVNPDEDRVELVHGPPSTTPTAPVTNSRPPTWEDMKDFLEAKGWNRTTLEDIEDEHDGELEQIYQMEGGPAQVSDKPELTLEPAAPDAKTQFSQEHYPEGSRVRFTDDQGYDVEGTVQRVKNGGDVVVVDDDNTEHQVDPEWSNLEIADDTPLREPQTAESIRQAREALQQQSAQPGQNMTPDEYMNSEMTRGNTQPEGEVVNLPPNDLGQDQSYVKQTLNNGVEIRQYPDGSSASYKDGKLFTSTQPNPDRSFNLNSASDVPDQAAKTDQNSPLPSNADLHDPAVAAQVAAIPVGDERVNFLTNFINDPTNEPKYDTSKLFAREDENGELDWNEDRAKVHDEIVNQILADADARGVARDRKAVMSGGMGGSGKGTILNGNEKAGIPALLNEHDWLTIDPDQIKEEIIKRDLDPDMPGFQPMEQAYFVHEESSHIAKLLTTAAAKRGYNTILDTTMASEGSTRKRAQEMKDNGYDIDAVFSDVPVQVSKDSARGRYLNAGTRFQDTGEGLGGRFVPFEYIDKSAPQAGNPYQSENRATLEHLRDEGFFDKVTVFDNSDRNRPPQKQYVWENGKYVEGSEAEERPNAARSSIATYLNAKARYDADPTDPKLRAAYEIALKRRLGYPEYDDDYAG